MTKTRCKQKDKKTRKPPEYQCKKCDGLAKKKKRLCKPEKL